MAVCSLKILQTAVFIVYCVLFRKFFKRDISSIFPDPFQIIEQAVFLVEYMDDDIAEIEQNPA